MQTQDLIGASQAEWQAYTEHDFVRELGAGTLNRHCFLHYLTQDFLFLKQYVRAQALAIYKAQTLKDMRHALPKVQAFLDHEIAHHVEYCKQWGLTELDMEAAKEDCGTLAYTRYVLDTGMSGDLVDLYTAMAPCGIGYAVIGQKLCAAPETALKNNPFASWLQLYGGDDFQTGAKQSVEYLNTLLSDIAVDSSRGQRLVEIFRTATRMEAAFWQQSLNTSSTGISCTKK